jgi:predicted DNA-binding ribbon-helix-helix protein
MRGRSDEGRGCACGSIIKRRTVNIAQHKTGVSLEEGFWRALKEIAAARNVAMNKLAVIDAERNHANLSSVLRVFTLEFYQGDNEGWNIKY